MQNIVIDKPYRFVPPYRGKRWLGPLRSFLKFEARRRFGVVHTDVQGAEKLRASIAAGHGVLITPNHCRDSDPLVLGGLSEAAGTFYYIMASWHLFMQGRASAWILNRAGAFSVYREGMDRASVNAATEILETAERPLVIFPEGSISRTNDRLTPLLEGVGVIARAAARKRAKATPAGKVVVHPVAIRYRFTGDLDAALAPTLEMIEARLSWRPQRERPVVERVLRIGKGLLALKEIEYLGQPQGGGTRERLDRLIDHLLSPLEAEWLGGAREPHLIGRVKKIRGAILPDLVQATLAEAEVERRWRQLADVYLAQSLSTYPADYITENPTPERILMTVEGFEEDLTDRVTPHPPVACTLSVGDAIEVNPAREARGSADPLLQRIEDGLRSLLGIGKGDAPAAVAPADADGRSTADAPPAVAGLPEVGAAPAPAADAGEAPTGAVG